MRLVSEIEFWLIFKYDCVYFGPYRGISGRFEYRGNAATDPGRRVGALRRLQQRRRRATGGDVGRKTGPQLLRKLFEERPAASRIRRDHQRRKVSILHCLRSGGPSRSWTDHQFSLCDLSLVHRWHRLGISIKGDTVTLISDCQKSVTKPLLRQNRRLSNAGIILIGQQLIDESLYSVTDVNYC